MAEPPLFVVADGLGGHKAGEVAAGITADTLSENAPTAADPEALARAVEDANTAILEAVQRGEGRQGMGTTVTAAIVMGTRIVLAQVGDSRAYMLRGKELSRVTRDHSLVGDMVRKGTLTEAEARLHPQRSVITRALGSRSEVQVDTYEITAEPGDRLLLCSDGLHGMIVDDEIRGILLGAGDAEDAVRALVAAANDAGGMDNITAVVVEVGESAPSSTPIPKRGILSILVWVFAALAIIAGSAVGLRAYARDRAYLIDEGGFVAVYRGLPGQFAGIEMSWLEQTTEIVVSDLPGVTADRLTDGIAMDDLAAAMDTVVGYRLSASDESTTTGEP